MRKLIALLLVFTMVCGLLPAAIAEAQPGVYQLMVRTDDGISCIGVAVLVDRSGTSLLTTVDALPEAGALYATGADGTLSVSGVTRAEDGSGLARLTLAKPSALAPLSLTTAAPATYQAFLADQTQATGTVSEIAADVYNNTDALSVRLQANVLPGSLLLSEDGALAGLVVSAANEGFDHYICLSGESLYNSLMAMTYTLVQPTAAPDATPAPQQDAGIVLPTWSINGNGQLELDFSDASAPAYVVWFGEHDGFWSSLQTEGASSICLDVAPGVTYGLWFTEDENNVDFDKPQMVVSMPEALPLTDYSYNTVEAFVGVGDASITVEEGCSFEAADVIPMKDMRSGKALLLYVHSTYEVAQELSLPSLLVLTAPNGSTVLVTSSYTFSPELQKKDDWSLNITSLLVDSLVYNRTRYGTYTLAYYIGGKKAASVNFVLTDSDDSDAADDAAADPEDMPIGIHVDDMNQLSVDISRCTQDSTDWRIFIVSDNASFSYAYRFGGALVQLVPLLPGESYRIWVQETVNGQLNPALASFTMTTKELGDFTEYGFSDAGSYITFDRIGNEPVTQITRSQLKEHSLLGVVSSQYTVEAKTELPSICKLVSPSGHYAVVPSSYEMSPDYMPVDTWDADLTAMLEQISSDTSQLPLGVYTYTYYIAGRTAATLTFELLDEVSAPADDTGAEADTPAEPEATPTPALLPPPPATLDLVYSAGTLTVDVSPLNVTGSQVDVYLQDTGNMFYSRYTLAEGVTEITIPVVPLRTYAVWIEDGAELTMDNTLVRYSIPLSNKLMEHRYNESAHYVTMNPTELPVEDTTVVPMTDELSSAALQSGTSHLFLQVISSYEVSEKAESNMVVSITLPDGSCLYTMGSFIFDPSLQQKDCWHLDLSEAMADLLPYTMIQGWIPGDYSVTWFMDGRSVNTVTFTLK